MELAEVLAASTSLVIYPSIVSHSGVFSNSDCNFLTGPSSRRACRVVACKPAHNVRIVLFDTPFRVVVCIEFEIETNFFQQAWYILVECRVGGPPFPLFWSFGRHIKYSQKEGKLVMGNGAGGDCGQDSRKFLVVYPGEIVKRHCKIWEMEGRERSNNNNNNNNITPYNYWSSTVTLVSPESSYRVIKSYVQHRVPRISSEK